MNAKPFLFASLLAFLFAGAGCVPSGQDDKTAQLLARVKMTSKVQILSLQAGMLAKDAVSGNADAFKSLEQDRAALADAFKSLKVSDPRIGAAWGNLDRDIGGVLDARDAVLKSISTAADFNSKATVLSSRIEEALKILDGKNTGSKSQVLIAGREMLLIDRMQRRMQAILNGNEESQSAADGLQRDAMFFGAVLAGFITGNADLNMAPMVDRNAKEIVVEVNQQWTDLVPELHSLIDAASTIVDAGTAADQARVDGQTLMLHMISLQNARQTP